MSYDPYAPPEALEPGPLGPYPQGSPEPWELGEVLRAGWAVYKPNWGPISLGLLVTGAIGAAVQQVPAALVSLGALEEDAPTARLLGFSFAIASWAIRQFFSAGLVRVALATMRTGNARFGDVFVPGPRFVPYLVTSLLSSLAIGLGLVLFVVPGVILALGLWMAPFFAYDRGLGPGEALRASWDTSLGHKGQFFVLGLTQIGLLVLGALACCIGVVVTEGVVLLARTIVFMRLAGLAQGTLASAARSPG